MDLVLVTVAALAAGAMIYFALRYGDAYRIGDTQYRRRAMSDRFAVLVPGLVLATSVALLALRRIAGDSITAQWRREIELLSEASIERERIKDARREKRKVESG